MRPLLRLLRPPRRGYRRRAPGEVAPGRILVVAAHWLGDDFWIAQVLPALRARYPGAAIEVATKAPAVALFDAADAVHVVRWVTSDRRREAVSWRGLAGEARRIGRRGFDLVVDLTGTRYSALFSYLTRPGYALGFGGAPLGRLYSRRVDPCPLPGEHMSRRPWRAVAPLLGPGAPEPPPDPAPVGTPAPWGEVARRIGLPDDDRPLALLAPGAGWPGKRWPTERFRDLAGRLEAGGRRVVVSGSPGEAALCGRVAAGAAEGRVAVGAVRELLALAGRADLVVSNDSAAGHLAAAAGARVVALFSATNPARWRPLGPRVTVVRAGCPFRPEGAADHCHDSPAYPCPPGCWDDVGVERVLAACHADSAPTGEAQPNGTGSPGDPEEPVGS